MTDRNELERLLAAATPGPWEIYRFGTGEIAGSAYGIEGEATVVCYGDLDDDFGGVRGDTPEEAHANAELICFLRNNAPHYLSLMDEVERLRGVMREYFAAKDACSDYINRRTQTPSIVRLAKLKDAEEVARQALGETHDN